MQHQEPILQIPLKKLGAGTIWPIGNPLESKDIPGGARLCMEGIRWVLDGDKLFRCGRQRLLYVYVHVYIYTYIYICFTVCIHILCIYIHIVCMYIYSVYTYIYIYILCVYVYIYLRCDI